MKPHSLPGWEKIGVEVEKAKTQFVEQSFPIVQVKVIQNYGYGKANLTGL